MEDWAQQIASRRIVVTGLGVIHRLGQDIDTFWESVIAGKSGISRVSRFDPSEYPCQVGAEIPDFDASQYMDPKEARRNDMYARLGMASSRVAVENAKLDTSKVDGDRFGVLFGSGVGGMQTIDDQSYRLHHLGIKKVSPFTITSMIPNMASGIIAIEFGARGPNFAVVSACATSSHAIGEAWRMMKWGEADIMIAGGSEASMTPFGYASFCAMKAMSTSFNDDPSKASRPFDAKRDGFVMGEGASTVILETLEHAQARGATIYAELVGYAASCDAHHITMPDPEGKGLALALRNALRNAGLKPEDVEYINAHGTSTPYNDKFETLAMKSVFGEHTPNISISSTKSMTGHLLGAAGALEAAILAKSLQTGIIPPTINYEFPDPDCDLNYVPNESIKRDIKVGMSNNLGFGGHNASLVMKRFEG